MIISSLITCSCFIESKLLSCYKGIERDSRINSTSSSYINNSKNNLFINHARYFSTSRLLKADDNDRNRPERDRILELYMRNKEQQELKKNSGEPSSSESKEWWEEDEFKSMQKSPETIEMERRTKELSDNVDKRIEEVLQDRPGWDKPKGPNVEKLVNNSNSDEEIDTKINKYFNKYTYDHPDNTRREEFDDRAREQIHNEYSNTNLPVDIDSKIDYELWLKDKNLRKEWNEFHKELTDKAEKPRENVPFNDDSDDSGISEGTVPTPSTITSEEEEEITRKRKNSNSEEVEAKRLKSDSNNNDDDDNNNPGGIAGGSGGEGSSGGNIGGNSNTSSRTFFDSIFIFLYSIEKDDDYLSPLDYVIEIEEENFDVSIFDIDI